MQITLLPASARSARPATRGVGFTGTAVSADDQRRLSLLFPDGVPTGVPLLKLLETAIRAQLDTFARYVLDRGLPSAKAIAAHLKDAGYDTSAGAVDRALVQLYDHAQVDQDLQRRFYILEVMPERKAERKFEPLAKPKKAVLTKTATTRTDVSRTSPPVKSATAVTIPAARTAGHPATGTKPASHPVADADRHDATGKPVKTHAKKASASNAKQYMPEVFKRIALPGIQTGHTISEDEKKAFAKILAIPLGQAFLALPPNQFENIGHEALASAIVEANPSWADAINRIRSTPYSTMKNAIALLKKLTILTTTYRTHGFQRGPATQATYPDAASIQKAIDALK